MTLYLLIFTVNPIISFYFIMNVTGRNRFLKFLIKFEIHLKALKIQEKLNVLKVENASFGEEIKKAW